MDIIIDLKNEKRSKVNVEMSWKISVAERKDNFWDKLPWIRNNQNIERHVYVTIQNISVPKEIVYDKDKLFSIVSKQQEFGMETFPVGIWLTQQDTPFQLFFNQQAISDCNEAQQRIPKKYSISFDVVVLDEANNKIDSHQESINITFASLDIKPCFAINIEKHIIQYNSQLSEVKVGEIVAWIEEAYKYTPKLSIETKIGIFDRTTDMGDVLFFKNKDGSRTQEWKDLLKPSRKELQRFEMYIDLSRISNPIEETECLTIESHSKFSVEYSPEIMLGTNKLDDLKLKFYRLSDLEKGKSIQEVSDEIRTSDNGFQTRHLHVGGDFDFIELTVPDGSDTCNALIIPKFKPCPATISKFTFCVDFGTTNTHVAYVSKMLGDVSSVTVNQIDNFSILRSEIQENDDSQIMILNDDRGAGYFVKFPTFLQREFVPFEIDKKKGIHYPMRTSTWEKIQQEGNLKCFSSINIGFNYDNELIKEGNTQGMYRTNIKWAKNDILAPTRLQEYFKEQLWMMKGKSALNGGGGDFKVVATYPLSMSVPEVQAFKNAWKSAARWLNINEANIKFEIESVAPYYSFLAGLKFGQPYMNLDIGGGTTDILHVNPKPGGKDASAVFSALFAANDIWGDGVNDANNKLENGFIDFYMQSDAYKILPDTKKLELKAVLEKAGLSSSDFISYLFTHDKDAKDPLNFSQTITSSSEMMRVIIVHFASLMYYTAIILDLAELKIPKKITFTGMGSKYIKLITDDEATLSLIVSRIFAYYGKLVDNNDLRAANIQIQFSEEPKLVTAQGGLIMESKPLKDHLIPDNCLCHGYTNEEYGTTVTYGQMSSMKKGILDSFNKFCGLFVEDSMVQALSKLGLDIPTNFVNTMKEYAESSFDIVLNDNSDEQKAQFAIGDPMFFWPLKETLYQMTKECNQEALNNKEKEHQ